MMSLTKLLKHNTKDCNEMLYQLFGRIICCVSSAESHLLDKDITIPVDICESRQRCTGPGGFSIRDNLSCLKAHGHAAMKVGGESSSVSFGWDTDA